MLHMCSFKAQLIKVVSSIFYLNMARMPLTDRYISQMHDMATSLVSRRLSKLACLRDNKGGTCCCLHGQVEECQPPEEAATCLQSLIL